MGKDKTGKGKDEDEIFAEFIKSSKKEKVKKEVPKEEGKKPLQKGDEAFLGPSLTKAKEELKQRAIEIEKEFEISETDKMLMEEEVGKEVGKAKFGEEEELILISGFLNDRFLITSAIEKGFKPFLLRSRQAKTMCNVIFELYDSQREDVIIDKNTLKNELIYKNYFTAEIQQFYNKLVQKEPPQLAQMMAYIDILKMRTGRDKLREISQLINDYNSDKGLNVGKDVADFAGDMAHKLMSIQKLQFHEVVLPMKYKMYELEDEIRNRKKESLVSIMGYSIYPYRTMNKVLSGLRKGFYYGLAGAPRRGKTNFSLSLATQIAAQNKIPILYYSWEQTQRVLTLRILSKESMINPSILQTENIMEDRRVKEKFIRGWRASESYMNYLFLIEGGQKDNFERIESHAYNIMHEFETDDIVIIIDYLQKMPLESHITDPQTRINRISSGLSELSLSLNCPIWAISSLDREGCKLDEKQSYERPTIHNTTGSGDIEYDLDVGIVVTKDWHDTQELNQQLTEIARVKNIPEEKVCQIDILNFYIDKNRDAPPGASNIIQYLFFIELNKLVELGFKNIEEEHTYTKVQDIVKKLIKTRMIWDEYEDLLEEYELMDVEQIGEIDFTSEESQI
jgi:replicative DNA helicase